MRKLLPALLRLLVLIGSIAIASVTPAHAATITVAVNGADGAGCGAKDAPCRTIGQAVANAASGDKLVVGPGRYGDLDHDGLFTGSGEESLGSGLCMIRVNKAVSIFSRDGAAATVIDAGGAGSSFSVAICLASSGITFGKPKKGFTVTGAANLEGVRVGVDEFDVTTTGIVVSGIRSTANLHGFLVAGIANVLRGNQAVGNLDSGFRLINGNGHLLAANLAAANQDGFFVFVQAPGTQLRGDVAAANGRYGFIVNGQNVLVTGSLATGNGDRGITMVQGGGLVTASAMLGNNGAGIAIGSGTTINKATIMGNGVAGTSNCGVESLGDASALNVFWGAPGGPAADPADTTCAMSGTIQVIPFATKELKVRPKLPPID